MCDSPAAKLKAARLKAGYRTVPAAFRAHEHEWPFALSTYGSYENGTRDIPPESARVLATTFKNAGLRFSDLCPSLAEVEGAPFIDVVGEPRMGNWIDSSLEETTERFGRLYGLPSKSGRDTRRALRIADESLNKYAGPGDHVIYTPLPKDPGALDRFDGELLYLECVLGKLMERSIRIAKLQKNGSLKLTAYSNVERYTALPPVVYPCTQGNVTLLGIVTARYSEGGPRGLSTPK